MMRGWLTNGEAEPIRVLVVDDQELFRRGLTMLLAAEDGHRGASARPATA